MRERQEIKLLAAITHTKDFPNHFIKANAGEKLFDGQFTNSKDEFGFENFYFTLKPVTAIGDFFA